MYYVKDSTKGSRIRHSFIPRKSELKMRIISANLTHLSKVPLTITNAKNQVLTLPFMLLAFMTAISTLALFLKYL